MVGFKGMVEVVAGVLRSTRTRLPVLLVLVLVLAGCNSVSSSNHSSRGAGKHVVPNTHKAVSAKSSRNSSPSNNSSSSTSSTTATIELQASNAWPTVMSSLPLSENVVSPITLAPAGVYRAIAYNGTTTSSSAIPGGPGELTVVVYKFVQGEWYSVTSVEYVTLPPLEAGTEGNSIEPAYLLSQQRPAYLVTVQGASNPFSGVVGKIPGQGWSKIGFFTPQIPGTPTNDGFASVVQDAQLADGGHEIETSTDNCSPSCVQGTNYQVTYGYSTETSGFTALNAPVATNNA